MEIRDDFKMERVSVRLVNDGYFYADSPFDNPRKAVEVMGDYLREMDKEVLMILNMTAKLKPINCSIISIGSVDQTLAYPHEMFKTAILSNAANILIMHNHPSGDVYPSKADCNTTDRMIQVCSLMGIPLVDHIIVGAGNDNYFSFCEKEIMKKSEYNFANHYNNIQFDRMVAEDIEEPERGR